MARSYRSYKKQFRVDFHYILRCQQKRWSKTVEKCIFFLQILIEVNQ